MNRSTSQTFESPSAALIEKVYSANPTWKAEDWELWWCKWGRNKWDHWKTLKVCDKCTCEKKGK